MRIRALAATTAAAAAATAMVVGALSAVGPAEAGSAAGPAAAAAAPKKRPNIVVIFTDDQRLDEMRYMPRTRRLIGKAGMTYRNALSENPLCCPFRGTILTGQYTHNNNVLGNDPGSGGGFPAFDQRRNLNVTLRQSGYATGYFGKFLNGYPSKQRGGPHYVPPGWSEWHVPVQRIYNYGRVTMNHNGTLRTHRGHKDDVYGRLSSAMLTRLARKRHPFFAAISYLAPHGGRAPGIKQRHPSMPHPARRHENSLRGTMSRMPGAFNERDMSDKPGRLQNRARYSHQQVRLLRDIRRARAESLMSADQAIARNMRALRRSGELRNTIVVFTSDNGFLIGQHRIVGKIVPYEESIRVPLMIRGPGFPAGTVNRSLVGIVDVASTFAHAGRVVSRMPYELDGRDLRGKRRLPTRPILVEAGSKFIWDPNSTIRRSYVGVRTPRYMYAKYWNGFEELYDLRRDRSERSSVSDDPAYSAVLGRLRATTQRLKDCVGAACRS